MLISAAIDAPLPVPERGRGAGPDKHGPGLGPDGGLQLRGERARRVAPSGAYKGFDT